MDKINIDIYKIIYDLLSLDEQLNMRCLSKHFLEYDMLIDNKLYKYTSYPFPDYKLKLQEISSRKLLKKKNEHTIYEYILTNRMKNIPIGITRIKSNFNNKNKYNIPDYITHLDNVLYYNLPEKIEYLRVYDEPEQYPPKLKELVIQNKITDINKIPKTVTKLSIFYPLFDYFDNMQRITHLSVSLTLNSQRINEILFPKLQELIIYEKNIYLSNENIKFPKTLNKLSINYRNFAYRENEPKNILNISHLKLSSLSIYGYILLPQIFNHIQNLSLKIVINTDLDFTNLCPTVNKLTLWSINCTNKRNCNIILNKNMIYFECNLSNFPIIYADNLDTLVLYKKCKLLYVNYLITFISHCKYNIDKLPNSVKYIELHNYNSQLKKLPSDIKYIKLPKYYDGNILLLNKNINVTYI